MGASSARPTTRDLRPSECNRSSASPPANAGARSVVHSHALSAVLAGDLAAGGDHVAIRDLEMLKGIRGVANRDVHLVPVIRNTPREPELVEPARRRPRRSALRPRAAVVVRPTTAPTSGATTCWDAKRHTEVYHFLFEAAVARRDRQKEAST